jgi:hypothetical protein
MIKDFKFEIFIYFNSHAPNNQPPYTKCVQTQ